MIERFNFLPGLLFGFIPGPNSHVITVEVSHVLESGTSNPNPILIQYIGIASLGKNSTTYKSNEYLSGLRFCCISITICTLPWLSFPNIGCCCPTGPRRNTRPMRSRCTFRHLPFSFWELEMDRGIHHVGTQGCQCSRRCHSFSLTTCYYFMKLHNLWNNLHESHRNYEIQWWNTFWFLPYAYELWSILMVNNH